MINNISLDSLDEMVDYISELNRMYTKYEKKECVFNPLIFLKILSLPFYNSEKEIKEKEEVIQKLVEVTPCQDRLKMYKDQFLIFYKDWLNKHYPDLLPKLKDIEIFQVDSGFFEFDRADVDNKIDTMQKKEIIDAKTFMKDSEIDATSILDIMKSMNQLIEVSKKHNQLTEDFVEELFKYNEFIKVFLYSLEFKDLAYSLEVLKLKLVSMDLSTINKQQSIVLKTMLDGILYDLNEWVHKVLIDQSAIDIHYLDASLLANISQIDIMLKSLDEKTQEDSDDELELF